MTTEIALGAPWPNSGTASKHRHCHSIFPEIVAVGTPVSPTPPAQNRTCRITAYGSYLRYLASKRRLGCGWRTVTLGIQRATKGRNRAESCGFSGSVAEAHGFWVVGQFKSEDLNIGSKLALPYLGILES
jgi:hypothetical protein